MYSPTPLQIRKARLHARLTQDAAAKLIGHNWRGWQNWEYGKRKMNGAKWELFLIKLKDLMNERQSVFRDPNTKDMFEK